MLKGSFVLGLSFVTVPRSFHSRTTAWNRRQTPHRARAFPPGPARVVIALLVVAGEFVRDARPHRPAAVEAATPVLQSTPSGVEVRTRTNSLTLLNHHGNAANQTVSARGDIGARYIDSDTESVTIDNVYLQ